MSEKRQIRSIQQFIRDKRRVNCPVCKVPTAIRDAIVDAKRKGFTVPTILEWLKSEYRIRLTPEQVRTHYSGMHDGRSGLSGRR